MIGARGIVLLIGLFAVIFIPESFAVEALERVPIDSPQLVNAFGVPVISHVNVNQQVHISADITAANYSGAFAYIVQIRDDENRVISLDWITGEINLGQTFSPAKSWIPSETGTFTAEIFVWKSLVNPEALSESAIIAITAS